MSTWREHPLCASPTPWPARFWGPERLDPTAWRELAGRLIIDDEIARLCAVLAGADRVIDVGGGTGLLTQALAAQVAPVTIVEFFDPACETCRAFYPIVKSLMAKYPDDVRLVIRYAPFHQGSDQVVKLLEAAKRQGKYQAVLEAVLQAQPTWADHGRPNPDLTFEIAKSAGLDIERAREDMARPEMQALLAHDVEDLTALQVSRTPTFFVNGCSLPSFGPDQLAALVAEEVAKAKRKADGGW